ncbi:MAG: oligosaccharide flippase family protein, partial [Victivallis sp.]
NRNMKVNQKKAGVLLSYLAQIIHILSGILYTPLMLRLLGQSEYGLYELVASVVSYLNVLSLGFGSSYMRFYSRIKEDGNEKKVASFNGMYLIVFIIIACICLFCGGVLLENIQLVFGSGLTVKEYSKAKILLALMVFNLALTFPTGAIDSFITAHEAFTFQK